MIIFRRRRFGKTSIITMNNLSQSHIDTFVIELLKKPGYTYLLPEEQESEREYLSIELICNIMNNFIEKLSICIG